MAQIPFTRGVPSADLLPVDDLRAAVDSALTREPALALAYLGGAGHPGLRVVDRRAPRRSRRAGRRLEREPAGVPVHRRAAGRALEHQARARRGSNLRQAPDPAAARRRRARRRAGRQRRARCRRARGRPAPCRRAGLPVRDPDVPEPERLDAAACAPRAARGALAPLRLPDRRGRSVRPAAIPRRDPADDPLARSRSRDHDVVVHEDGGSGSAHRLRGRADRPRDASHPVRDRHLHRARRARTVDARRVRRGRQLRAERRSAPPQSLDVARRAWLPRCASTSRPGRTSSSRTAATSCGSTSATTARIRPSCSLQRPRPACRTSRAPTSTRPPAGSRRCRLAFSAVSSAEIGEGIARLAEVVARTSALA